VAHIRFLLERAALEHSILQQEASSLRSLLQWLVTGLSHPGDLWDTTD
jgi:hypothetical protein